MSLIARLATLGAPSAVFVFIMFVAALGNSCNTNANNCLGYCRNENTFCIAIRSFDQEDQEARSRIGRTSESRISRTLIYICCAVFNTLKIPMHVTRHCITTGKSAPRFIIAPLNQRPMADNISQRNGSPDTPTWMVGKEIATPAIIDSKAELLSRSNTRTRQHFSPMVSLSPDAEIILRGALVALVTARCDSSFATYTSRAALPEAAFKVLRTSTTCCPGVRYSAANSPGRSRPMLDLGEITQIDTIWHGGIMRNCCRKWRRSSRESIAETV